MFYKIIRDSNQVLISIIILNDRYFFGTLTTKGKGKFTLARRSNRKPGCGIVYPLTWLNKPLTYCQSSAYIVECSHTLIFLWISTPPTSQQKSDSRLLQELNPQPQLQRSYLLCWQGLDDLGSLCLIAFDVIKTYSELSSVPYRWHLLPVLWWCLEPSAETSYAVGTRLESGVRRRKLQFRTSMGST